MARVPPCSDACVPGSGSFYAEHWKVGTIASELGVHPDTVKAALGGPNPFVSRGPKSRASLLEPYADFIRDTLEEHPRLRSTRLYDMLVDRGYEGSRRRRRPSQRSLHPSDGGERRTSTDLEAAPATSGPRRFRLPLEAGQIPTLPRGRQHAVPGPRPRGQLAVEPCQPLQHPRRTLPRRVQPGLLWSRNPRSPPSTLDGQVGRGGLTNGPRRGRGENPDSAHLRERRYRPELRDRIRLRKNRSLYSRIHTRLHLGDAAPEDSYEYVAHRLALAGTDKDPFDADALALLHEASGGRLRDIDRIATDALKRASRNTLKRVDRKLLESAIDIDELD